MKISIVAISEGDSSVKSRFNSLVCTLQTKLVERGAEITSLPLSDVVIICTEQQSFWSKKLPANFAEGLEQQGSLLNKKGYAVLIKRGLFSGASMGKLMKQLEKQGLFLRNSWIIASEKDATDLGEDFAL